MLPIELRYLKIHAHVSWKDTLFFKTNLHFELYIRDIIGQLLLAC